MVIIYKFIRNMFGVVIWKILGNKIINKPLKRSSNKQVENMFYS